MRSARGQPIAQADHTAIPRVEDDGQIKKARPGWDVGDICHPEPIGSGGGEGAGDQIGRRGRGVAVGLPASCGSSGRRLELLGQCLNRVVALSSG